MSNEEDDAMEVKRIDDEMLALKSSKEINHVQMQNTLKGLKSLESSIQEAEEELECVYRQLLKARVTILNVVSH